MHKFSWMKRSLVAAGAALAVSGAAFGAVELDPKLATYKPVDGVSGTIKSVGSDTMNNMMTLWAEGFLQYYPNVQVEIEGKGSSTAPPALITGTANFGPMSRALKDGEQDKFEQAFGYKATQLSTGIDMLAVFVNKDNPIKGLTLPQVDAIFSSTRKGGYKQDITNWGELGLTGPWASMPISLYGRNAASGTYGFFKKIALFKGDYKPTVKEQPGSSSVVQGVANDKGGIGYSGIGYKTADVRAVPLAKNDGGKFYAPQGDDVASYPLSRSLLLTVNYKPGSKMDPLRREFIKFIFSKQGQEVVMKDGYYPLNAKMAAAQLKKVGIK